MRQKFIWILLLLNTQYTVARLRWDYTFKAASPRSLECATNSKNCVCYGSGNGRTTVMVSLEKNLNHYERLKLSFIGCRRIVGNLEITHIDESDLKNDFEEKIDNDNQTIIQIPKRPFEFLEDLEEITGYLFIYNVQLKTIEIPKLTIIWGEQTHEGNALQVDTSWLQVLSLPSLRSIENGNITIKQTPELCYMNPLNPFVDYSEILGKDFKNKLQRIGTFSSEICSTNSVCHPECNGACFGPESNQCQTLYRKICNSCDSNSCYLDEFGSSRCCDDACTGGCYGNGKDKCVACKRFEQDGRCVNECRGIFDYHPTTLIKFELSDDQKRFFYGRHCVHECPVGTLIEDKYCVARCSSGYHRDMKKDDRTCVPCIGICPKICKISERINALNIRNFINCTEIEGNIEILGHVFKAHLPDHVPGRKSSGKLIPALLATDLEVLKSVRIVTGNIVIDGGAKRNPHLPTSLGFLENLEMIEGRHLYFDKYSIYIIGNYDLKWLGLKSLKRIKNGLISFKRNQLLCYSYKIPFEEVLGVKESYWSDNMNETECENSGRKCDSSCDPKLGCWGPGPNMCVRCKNYIKDGICSDECPIEGYYISESDNRTCHRCHEQCLECRGTLSTDCIKCRNFELWTRNVGDNEKSLTILAEPVRKCVSKCPNQTYPVDMYLQEDWLKPIKRCEPCDEACYEYGCTGPKFELGLGGCNRCRYGIENETSNKVKCLIGETEETVCGESNNITSNYFVGLGTQNISKYMCRKCRSECKTCLRESVAVSECECKNYRLMHGEMEDEAIDYCVNECGKGSYIIKNKSLEIFENASDVGICRKCHWLCDERYSCNGTGPFDCDKCALVAIQHNDSIFECLSECPLEQPFLYEGLCDKEDKAKLFRIKRYAIIISAIIACLLCAIIIMYLIYRSITYRKKYEKEAQMHLPEIPALDPRKVTQRPNMRRLNLIAIDELDDSKNNILGSGAFGIVYAGKWKPPTAAKAIPVAIKAINPSESRHTTDAEMMKEAGLMASIQHEHLLSLVGICLAKSGLKIVTILRPLGSLLKFLDTNKNRLSSKYLMLYCYQISSAMEFLAKKKIVHRDLAARNVLVKKINHVEVTDFGLAQMLQGGETSVVIEGRVAVKWLAIESLRQQIYTERTDVWSFGVTCWEIVTFGGSPYKELRLPRDQKLARELASNLEKGYRLKQPTNCSQELYQELLNCWMIDPDSRPAFRQIKEKFELFCRAPHIYIQDLRQTTQQMYSITSTDQRLMIERLLQDNDFLDPINIGDPVEEYGNLNNNNNTNFAADESALPSPTSGGPVDGGFFSSNTLETILPPYSPTTTTSNRPLFGDKNCHGSVGSTCASSRYKSDPVDGGHKRFTSSSTTTTTSGGDEQNFNELEMDEENYLMPKRSIGKRSLIKQSIDEEDENESMGEDLRLKRIHGVNNNAGLVYTPVISEEEEEAQNENDYLPTYLNDAIEEEKQTISTHDYKNTNGNIMDEKINNQTSAKPHAYINSPLQSSSINPLLQSSETTI